MFDGNKCGKCQNHDYEVFKKGHARDCPFKRCECLKCRLLDARSDILQVISGKETKLKGTKKDPNCGFCQNHGVKILRKGHVRSCGFGQERHFRLENCFDCEVHYIRNEVNRLQIKMRRAMKEDRTLSEEQRKTAREAITRDEVEKVCEMARLARNKRETILSAQQVGESSALRQQPARAPAQQQQPAPQMRHAGGTALSVGARRAAMVQPAAAALQQPQLIQPSQGVDLVVRRPAPGQPAAVWRPWSPSLACTAMVDGVGLVGAGADADQSHGTLLGQQHEQQQQLQQQQLFNAIFGLFFARFAADAQQQQHGEH